MLSGITIRKKIFGYPLKISWQEYNKYFVLAIKVSGNSINMYKF